MKTCVAILLLISLLCERLPAQQAGLLRTRYRIDATLDDKHHAIDGTIDLRCTNSSADTLRFLWLQLWPNAFKNDRTAYSEHLLNMGRNDFYFSAKEQKGYINRLVFRSGNDILVQEDHPQYIDLVKVYLREPVAPGSEASVSTPFHVQLPYNFSGFGHIGRTYSLQNWYPAVAALDADGWHPQPYTGEGSATISDYEVSLTIPKKYSIHADGKLQDSTISDSTCTYRFRATQVHDLAWTASVPGTRLPMQQKNADDYIQQEIPKLLSKYLLPAVGYNVYDGLQIGLVWQHLAHEHKQPLTWFGAPLFATGSRSLTGLAGVAHDLSWGHYFKKITVGVNASRFSMLKDHDSTGQKVFGSFFKIVPYLKVVFPQSNAHNSDWLEFRHFTIGEKYFSYVKYSVDSLYYPAEGTTDTRYLNQLTFEHQSCRSLYPYHLQLQVQQANTFYRVNAEVRYFFNYADGGGMQARLFGAKFGYLGHGSSFNTYSFQPKLTAVRGDEDYTYSNAFLGRNEFSGLAAHQIVMRDGGLKLRTDLFGNLQGRSDNWIASMNLNTSLPADPFGKRFPLKVFFDAGTFAQAWQKGTDQPRFLYVAGLQLNVLKDLLQIYAPVLYSKEFRDNFKTVPEENSLFKKMSFSLDLNAFLARLLQQRCPFEP